MVRQKKIGYMYSRYGCGYAWKTRKETERGKISGE